MKKTVSALMTCLLVLFGFTGCAKKTQHTDPVSSNDQSGIELPEDFSFSIVWGTYGVSSYDSKSGKLFKAIPHNSTHAS